MVDQEKNDHEQDKVTVLMPGPARHSVKCKDQLVIILWI